MLRNALVTVAAAALLLAAGADALTPEEEAQGFETLFPNGRFADEGWNCWNVDFPEAPPCASRRGWESLPDSNAIGTSDTAGANSAASLFSNRTWRDFETRFEYRVDGAAAFYYRITDTGHEHPRLHLAYMMYPLGTSSSYPGGMFEWHVDAPDTVTYPSHGGWIAARVVANGDRVRHWRDGQMVLDVSILSPAFRDSTARGKLPSATFDTALPWDGNHPLMRSGPIGWLGDWGNHIRIRDFRIATLPLKPAALFPPARVTRVQVRFAPGDPTRIRVSREGKTYDTRGRASPAITGLP